MCNINIVLFLVLLLLWSTDKEARGGRSIVSVHCQNRKDNTTAHTHALTHTYVHIYILIVSISAQCLQIMMEHIKIHFMYVFDFNDERTILIAYIRLVRESLFTV
ncbi:hypothetical protein XENTR_v10016778 [Xenopus tropicalis]|nr:hypothetical protein XENTR_v10016778 [Xenopus tropicalis]